MKGTILDFLKLATEKPDLTEELVELAAKHGFEFSDEVSDEDLEAVAGGTVQLAEAATASIDSIVSSSTSSRNLMKSTLTLLVDAAARRESDITKLTSM